MSNQAVTATGLGASFRFHLSSGARVTLGLATFQLVLLLVLVALQPPQARELLLKGLAAALALLGLAYLQAGRWSPRSARVPSVPSSLRSLGRRLPTGQLVFSLRALGLWITLAHLPAVLFAAPAGLAIHNNEFTADQTDLVLRLGTSLGVTATVLAVATLLSARRPPWAWSRSLPWSARQRVAVDAVLLLLIASPLLIPLLYLPASSGLSVLALLVFLAVRLPGRMRNSLRGLTRLGAWTWIEALLAALLTSLQPLTALVLGLASPLVLEASARRERSLKVGLYLERRFDAARETGS